MLFFLRFFCVKIYENNEEDSVGFYQGIYKKPKKCGHLIYCLIFSELFNVTRCKFAKFKFPVYWCTTTSTYADCLKQLEKVNLVLESTVAPKM